VPEAHWDGTAGKIKDEAAYTKWINDHVAFKAAEDSRRLTLPQKPEDYKPTVTKDFKPPQGIEFVPNENDPLLPHARAFAQKHGLSQDAFSELMDLHASGVVSSMQAINNAKASELAKLGTNGVARKTEVDRWLQSQVGDELGAEISKYTFSAKQIEGIEKLMANWRTQGQGSFSPQHRESEQPGKVSDAEYESMSFSEKRAYAAKFGNPTTPQQANGR
jgi:hypothetical protein